MLSTRLLESWNTEFEIQVSRLDGHSAFSNRERTVPFRTGRALFHIFVFGPWTRSFGSRFFFMLWIFLSRFENGVQGHFLLGHQMSLAFFQATRRICLA